jgi:prepilin-type N-terminal cleavage/methylation domain-containing protein
MKKLQILRQSDPLQGGFTLAEILVVVVILGMAMYLAVPMFSDAAQMQLQSAANIVAADLEYAKSMAISRQQFYSIVFDPDADTYRVEDTNGVVVLHPVKLGFDYKVEFRKDSRLNKVDLVSADFGDSSHRIKFDYLGSPYNGSGAALNSGTITLHGGANTVTITIEPVTGYIRIQ